MFRYKTAAILFAGLILLVGATAMAQSVAVKTMVNDAPLTSTAVPAGEFSIDPEWLQNPTLYCMNLDRNRPPITRKRLALDKSLQELSWVATHGPRQDMLAAFLSRQAANKDTAGDGQLARVGESVDSWSEILAGTGQTGYPLFNVSGLNVSLIGPQSVRR